MKKTHWMTAAFAALTLALAATGLQAQEKKAPATSAAAKAPAQRQFATPEDAVKALVDAVRAEDANSLLAVIGPKSKSWLFSGDKVADKAAWKKFLAAYDLKNNLTKEGDAKAVLGVGDDNWTFPAPLVRAADQWAFDADAGREEVINRRVGRNELDTMQTLLAIVDAQREYALHDADGNGLADYAVRFASTPGKKDGLYWPTKDGEPPSPLGPLVAKAVREGYSGKARAGQPQPYHGYIYRMLTAQGKDAPGGAYSYLLHGKLFGGFAVLAYPATYGASGVKSFMVNHDGVVYEGDLGPKTATEAARIRQFNPGPGWTRSDVK
ncbi:MAG TPA: DUF2950 domain-containing protein [Ramlibacter sp.]|nr:DUF2950 domain-containing protein [Ramlibacter sp.]